ncbi:MAG: CRISPR system precrRNA processing endoribonuclease RAMP protein Cas6 [Thermoflexales bacterium]|nr:CRISPR system precrRNA processing endoribonuclease RAMP protein Cas6 [Thermoflexales bacterium]
MTETLSNPLTAHPLFFELQAVEPMLLHRHNGSALRGMLYRAVVELATGEAPEGELAFRPDDPVLQRLLATLDEAGPRGQDAPRPYVIEPPVEDGTNPAGRLLRAGETFTFGLTLFGSAMEAFTVIVMALKLAEERGLGRFLEAGARGGRGRFRLVRATALNPLTRTTQEFLSPGERIVRPPTVVVQQSDIAAQVAIDLEGRPTRLRLHFHTPATLKTKGELLRTPVFSVVIHRLIERLTEMTRHHGQPPLACLPTDREGRNALLHRADAVALVDNHSRWTELSGHSERTRSATNLSGITGTADYAATDFSPFLEILRWGEIVHVGQNAVKGNGVLRIQPLS